MVCEKWLKCGTSMQGIKHLHDRYFEQAMKDSRIAHCFFNAFLPDSIKSKIDLSTLKLESESFVDSNLSKIEVDILYSVKLNHGKHGVYILVEQQTKSQKYFPFRLLTYIYRIMKAYYKRSGRKDLPPVFPIVFYNGKNKYCHSNHLCDTFSCLPNEMRKFFTLKPMLQIDARSCNDNIVEQQLWSGLMIYAMKHVNSGCIIKMIKKIVPQMRRLIALGGEKYILSTCEYMAQASDVTFNEISQIVNLIDKHVSSKVAGGLMNGRERLIQHGRKQGVEQGVEQGIEQKALSVAKKMLMNNLNIQVVHECTGLSRSAIEKLRLELVGI